ncbi:hypothetical protein H9P43_008558 [Blastocladiella emersonii ATCC 22665]|nr:hypothetical protein H9P43_008558 [Blastocladiella emersonii ATCC 22665]
MVASSASAAALHDTPAPVATELSVRLQSFVRTARRALPRRALLRLPRGAPILPRHHSRAAAKFRALAASSSIPAAGDDDEFSNDENDGAEPRPARTGTATASARLRDWLRRGGRSKRARARAASTSPSDPAAQRPWFRRPAVLEPASIEELKKMFVPLSSLGSLVFLLTGPWLLPLAWLHLSCVFFATTLLVNCSHLVRYTYAVVQLRRTLGAWSSGALRSAPSNYYHVVVVPNYAEPEPLLRDTLARLAAHPAARDRYLVVLAMEASEHGHAEKAARLAAAYAPAFADLLVTVHPAGIPGECRGKGSNVAWAVDQAVRAWVAGPVQPVAHDTRRHRLGVRDLDPARVVLTITDADSVVPELYFCEVERELASPKYPHQHAEWRFFVPPIFFGRNPDDVPAAVRATDAAWSCGLMQNLANARAMHFPCSTYSVTLPLAIRAHGWCTGRDAVGEDLHMFLKCFYVTATRARATPIWVPINLANVATDDGYLADCKAKFVQAARHFSGSADSLFALRHTFFPDTAARVAAATPAPGLGGVPWHALVHDADPTPARTWRRFADRLLCLVHVFEAHMVPATSWMTILAIPVASVLNPSLTAHPLFALISRLSMLLAAPYVLLIALYECQHRFVEASGIHDTPVGHSTRKWRHLLDYTLLPLCALVFVAAPAMSNAQNAWRLIWRGTVDEFEYVVAAKSLAGLGIASSASGPAVELDEVVVVVPEPASIAALLPPLPRLDATDSAFGDADTCLCDVPCTCNDPCPVHADAEAVVPAAATVPAAAKRPAHSLAAHHQQKDSGFFEPLRLAAAEREAAV